MDRYEALELLYEALPQTWIDAGLIKRLNGYPWLPEEQEAVAKALRRMKRFDTKDDLPYTQVMELMKDITGCGYREPVADGFKRSIRSIFSRGFGLDDFKVVFRRKADEWKGTKWESFLRPQTLLSPEKFESYRLAPDSSKPNVSQAHRAPGTTPNNSPIPEGQIEAAKRAAKGL